jgi:hypothetical protein
MFVCYFYFCSVFVLCLVFPLLSVSLDCLSHCCQCLWIVYPIVVSVCGLSVPLLSVRDTDNNGTNNPETLTTMGQTIQRHWQQWEHQTQTLTTMGQTIHRHWQQSIVVSVSGLSVPLLSVSLDCLSHCCQCLWIVYPIVVSVSELSIHDYALRDYVLYQFLITYSQCL